MKRNNLPNKRSKDKQENRDGLWIGQIRQSKQENSKVRRIFYPEFSEIAKKYGFPEAFETINPKVESIKKCEEIFKRAKELGYLPKNKSKNKQECKDNQWIATKKMGRKGIHWKWYPEFLEIAKKYGFPDAFGPQM